MNITPSQTARLAQLRAMHARHADAWKRFASFSRSGASSADAKQQAQINAVQPFSNEERAELQTLLFLSTPPQREFFYPSQDLRRLTGFMGNTLATITSLGAPFRSCFGDKRRSVRATGINGARYYGAIYGAHARLTPYKV